MEEPSHLKTFETLAKPTDKILDGVHQSAIRQCDYSRDKTAHGGAVLSEACLQVAGFWSFKNFCLWIANLA